MTHLSEGDDGRTVQLAIGAELELGLPENPGTGFRWHIKSDAPAPGHSPIAGLIVDRFTPGGQPGQAGQHVWQWRGLRAGHADLILELSRAWQSKPGRTFTLHLTVAG